MLILGITGGVGSGKSKILYDLSNLYGAYIVETDKLAHTLMEPGQTVYQAGGSVWHGDFAGRGTICNRPGEVCTDRVC